MALKIEDYALIGDTQTAGLVGNNGSIDWLCFPRFDSGACFAALLGNERNGRWKLAPSEPIQRTTRRYRPQTLVLETEFTTASGAVRVVDCMPIRQRDPDVVRIVEGIRGRVPMRMQLVIRTDYGSVIPWVRRVNGTLRAVAGPDGLVLWTPVETRGENFTTVARFEVGRGDRLPFVLIWHPSHEEPPNPVDAPAAVTETEQWWRDWSRRSTYHGRWGQQVQRSLITLKALTYEPSGGIVAAPTTSLPEKLGGVRNWDYRYCWLRDATLTLDALMMAGYTREAQDWRDWLLRTVAGDPSALQIMYGPAGERRLPELELPWLPGYERSAPVRVGNAASEQFQLDVYGEVMDALHEGRRAGIPADEVAWRLQRALLNFLETGWRQPDEGIWEVRGPRRHFTHSKVMAWVAMDRAVKAVERFGLPGSVECWRRTRDAIHDQVCTLGYDSQQESFVQYYGSRELDASLLILPLVGFLPPSDRRVVGTVAAIQRRLCTDGLVARYPTDETVDGLPPPAKVRSWPARSGWSTTSPSQDDVTKRSPSSNVC